MCGKHKYCVSVGLSFQLRHVTRDRLGNLCATDQMHSASIIHHTHSTHVPLCKHTRIKDDRNRYVDHNSQSI